MATLSTSSTARRMAHQRPAATWKGRCSSIGPSRPRIIGGMATTQQRPEWVGSALFDAERQAEVWYFDAAGAAEITRTLFAAAEMPFVDKRYSFSFEEGRPKVEEQHGLDKDAGLFDPNLGRLPLLVLPDGGVVGQSKAIERLVARELGLLGSDEVEAGMIDAYCEHIRDITTAYGKARGSPFGPPDEETQAKLSKWFEEDMPGWMNKLEKVTGSDGSAVGGKLSLADIALYVFLTQSVKDERCAKTYEDCPGIIAVIGAVGQQAGVKTWLKERPDSMF